MLVINPRLSRLYVFEITIFGGSEITYRQPNCFWKFLGGESKN